MGWDYKPLPDRCPMCGAAEGKCCDRLKQIDERGRRMPPYNKPPWERSWEAWCGRRGVSGRIVRLGQRLLIATPEDLCSRYTAKRLLELPNFGKRSLVDLQRLLRIEGLYLREDWNAKEHAR